MKVYFETLGCPKNFNDTEVAKGILENNQIDIVNSPEEADYIVVNTCGFINDAKVESINTIFEMSNYGKKLIVSGCLSERYHDELINEMPEVDMFIGVNEYEKLPELLNEKGDKVTSLYEKTLALLPRKLDENPYSATLMISEGCDNRCAYCVIPSIRGGFRSKKMEDCLSEAKDLADKGVKELILIAQDLTNYGNDLYGELKLAELVEKLSLIDGIEWIRLMYCYEDRITDELIDVISRNKKVCHYLDIPIQHSSNNVLKGMFRRSTRESIVNTIERLRKKIPDIAIRTTLIVGFPGETEDDFLDLVSFVEEEKFARLGVFAYSQEEGTPAGDREDQIDEAIKQERLDKIMRTQIDISLANNKKLVGSSLEVIIDEIEDTDTYVGRSVYDAPEIDNSVIFKSSIKHKPGDIVNVLIQDAFDYDLVGVEQ